MALAMSYLVRILLVQERWTDLWLLDPEMDRSCKGTGTGCQEGGTDARGGKEEENVVKKGKSGQGDKWKEGERQSEERRE